jgi:hypothetical protein
MSLSYHPLHIANMFVYAIAVHQLLTPPVLPVPLQHGSKLVRRPPTAEPVPDLWIFHQPNDVPLKVLLLGQIDPVDLGELHLLLQHLHAKENYICIPKEKNNNFNTCVQKRSKFTCI